MRSVSLVLAAFAALLLPEAAGAATIRSHVPSDRSTCGHRTECFPVVELTAAPGEANRIDVTVTRDAFVLRDVGATLDVGPGCTALDAHTASCPLAVGRVAVLAGDGDDVVTSSATPRVDLGDGDDLFVGTGGADGGAGRDELRGADTIAATLRGGAGDDLLVGGVRGDELMGGAGRDTLLGGAGDDELHAGDADAVFDPRRPPEPPAADTIDGGPGRDTLSYETRDHRGGVVVDLTDGLPEGRPGEGDIATGMEDVVGTPGDDWLVGDEGPNAMNGDGGTDRLDGRGGDDHLETAPAASRTTMTGGDGDDVLEPLGTVRSLDGGAGDDTVWGGWPAVRCGPGNDRVLQGDAVRARYALRDCETLRFGLSGGAGTGTLVLRADPVDGRLVLRLTCPRAVPSCRTRAAVGRHARRRSIPPGRSRSLALPLPAETLRAARRVAGVHVTVALEVRLRDKRLTARERRPTRIRLTLVLRATT